MQPIAALHLWRAWANMANSWLGCMFEVQIYYKNNGFAIWILRKQLLKS
jgi:hypothetical protein